MSLLLPEPCVSVSVVSALLRFHLIFSGLSPYVSGGLPSSLALIPSKHAPILPYVSDGALAAIERYKRAVLYPQQYGVLSPLEEVLSDRGQLEYWAS